MKFIIPTLFLLLFTSCDSMEVQAGEDSRKKAEMSVSIFSSGCSAENKNFELPRL